MKLPKEKAQELIMSEKQLLEDVIDIPLLLKEGMRVSHKRFGKGEVLLYNDTYATIKFNYPEGQKTTKTLLRRFAKLESNES